jgi:choloylglycine hydrolase
MCTDFVVYSEDRTVVNGRSMEYTTELHTQVLARSAGVAIEIEGEAGEKMPMTPKHSYIGMAGFGLPLVCDGMNSVGLSAGALWFPGSHYQARSNSPNTRNVFAGFFIDHLLGNYASVAEVAAAFAADAVRIVGDSFVAKKGPLHFTVHDAGGASLVIECIDGEARLHDNKVGVLTNLPPYPWQVANLGLYTHLTPWDSNSVTLGSLELDAPGSASGNPGIPGRGGGLSGIPGNSQPASRFVRTAYMKQFATPAANADEAILQAFHLLNGVDIVRGCVRNTKSKPHFCGLVKPKIEYDTTQWIVVKDMTNLKMYIRTAHSPLVYCVDMGTIDFSGKGAHTVPIPTGALAIPLKI